jgi:putative glutamine amidotransferase
LQWDAARFDVPVVEDPPAGLLTRMDGLMLTGGGDVDPALYGEVSDPSVYGVRRDRDAFKAVLYREAVALGLPILAICRGMQLINVLRGGTLLQQIKGGPGHWQQNPPTMHSHEISVTLGTSLADAMGQAVARVNSYHHQGPQHHALFELFVERAAATARTSISEEMNLCPTT